MQTALVTGASGFVGSHLCEELLRRGWKVRAMILPGLGLDWLEGAAVEVVRGDVTDSASLERPVRDVDYIFHLAGVTTSRNPEAYDRVNRDGTGNLLKAVVQSGTPIRKLLLFSSLAASEVVEAGATPVSRYGASKRGAELLLEEYASALPVAVLRLPAVYGPRDRACEVFFRMTKWPLVPVLNITFSLCYVADAVAAAIALAECSTASAQPCTACDGSVHEHDGMMTLLQEIMGVKHPRFRVSLPLLTIAATVNERFAKPGDVFGRDKLRELQCGSWVCTNDLLHQWTGFTPKYDLRTGLQLTADWYRQNGWL